MQQRDRELLYVVAFILFFPWSAVFLGAVWLIRKRKRLTAQK